METIERLKLILNKSIFRTHGGHARGIMCLHTYDAITNIKTAFPALNEVVLFKIISNEIHIKNGKYTTFVFGYTSAARLINKLLQKKV